MPHRREVHRCTAPLGRTAARITCSSSLQAAVARQLLAALLVNLGLIIFILIAVAFRSAMLALLLPTRSYVLSVSVSLATACNGSANTAA